MQNATMCEIRMNVWFHALEMIFNKCKGQELSSLNAKETISLHWAGLKNQQHTYKNWSCLIFIKYS